MKYLYVPVYRMAVSYVVSFGRRWSIVEHMLLVATAESRWTARELAAMADVPHRLAVEALINLLRANWVDVRSDDDEVRFAATAAGRRRAKEKNLPERLQRDVRWDAVCVDRLTGHWMRAEDLDLVYEKDLPADASRMPPLLHTFEPNDAALRDLFRLNLDESLEPVAPQFRAPSLPFARVGVAFDGVQAGLPATAPLALRKTLLDAASVIEEDSGGRHLGRPSIAQEAARDDITPDDLIVGGQAHLVALYDALAKAKSTVVVHSCFLSATTLRALLPDLELAAKRKIAIELLWGLHTDPEASEPPRKLSDAIEVLSTLPPGARGRVRLSPQSSGSHAKVLVYDDRETGHWTTVVGSCNYLSSEFDWMELSLRTRSALFASQVVSRLLSSQLPAVGNWSATARRLNAVWSDLKRKARAQRETGAYAISLISDHDHYACVTLARDRAEKEIEVVCDLYGLAAETSVLVPMENAASRGLDVQLRYTRPSKFLLDEGQEPSPTELERRGLNITRVDEVHAKYLGWDEGNLAISSFNWMATSVDGKRSRGAEIGALIQGPDIRTMLAAKLRSLEENHGMGSVLGVAGSLKPS